MLSLLVSIGFQVLFHSPPGVLFTFPSRYYTLSVTRSYLGLGDGPPTFIPGFTCPELLWIPTSCLPFRLRGYYSLWQHFPMLFDYGLQSICVGPNPDGIATTGLACSAFARHYSRNRLFAFFSSGYLDVSVPRVPFINLCIQLMMTQYYPRRVSPFGHLRLNAYLQLPVAFRSLSRPSSASGAKASTLCSL